MKEKLLISSGALVIAATSLSLCNSIFTNDPMLAMRLVGVSWTLGLGSIGLFFIGLAFPKSNK